MLAKNLNKHRRHANDMNGLNFAVRWVIY